MKKVLLCLCAIFSIAPFVSAEILFQEDFDGSGSDLVAEMAQLKSDGWEFVAANGAPDSLYAEFTIMFNLDASPGGRNPKREANPNPPDERGLPTSGNFLITDADAYDGDWTDPATDTVYPADGANFPPASGQSEDAITPSFDCSTANQVWLSVDTASLLNNNGFAVFVVDVKAGDGDWQTAAYRSAPNRLSGVTQREVLIEEGSVPYVAVPGKDGNMGALYGRFYADLTQYAAGKSNVRVRFRHFEQDWDWWISLDNVVVSTSPPPQGEDVLLEKETFDDGAAFPPAEWSLSLGAVEGDPLSADVTEHQWNQRLEGGPYSGEFISEENPDIIIAHEDFGVPDRHKGGSSLNRLAGQGYAIYQSFNFLDFGFDPTTNNQSYLDTPALDCSGHAEVFFYAWMEYLPGDNFIGKVQVSADGGDYTDIFVYQQALDHNTEDAYAMEYYLPVPEAAGKSNVVFRFVAGGHSGAPEGPSDISFFAIDDVQITGNKTTAVPNWMLQ